MVSVRWPSPVPPAARRRFGAASSAAAASSPAAARAVASAATSVTSAPMAQPLGGWKARGWAAGEARGSRALLAGVCCRPLVQAA